MALSVLSQNDAMNFTENQHGGMVLERLLLQRQEARFSDVLLKVAGKRFLAHRAVLAACSPYFLSMFTAGKMAREEVSVDCKDSEAFSCFLNYIYTGTVVVDKQNVTDLLHLADLLIIERLKEYCIEYLERYMQVSNCLQIQELAEKYKLSGLLRSASQFISCNSSEVLEQPYVLQYNNPKLRALIKEQSKSISPSSMLSLILRWVEANVEERENELRGLLTWVPWKELDPEWLVGRLGTSPLLQSSQKNLFTLLQSMDENGLQLLQYQDVYNSLKHKFLPDSDNFDNEKFLTMAISAAIGDFNETEREKGPFDSLQGIEANIDDPQDLLNSHAFKMKLKSMLQQNKTFTIDSTGYLKELQLEKTTANSEDVASVDIDDEGEVGLQIVEDLSNETSVENVRQENGFHPSSETQDKDANVNSNETKKKPSNRPKRSATFLLCSKCSFKTRMGDARLEKHVSTVHSGNVTSICPVCRLEFSWNKELYDHMKEHYKEVPYRCDVKPCDFTADRIQKMMVHRMLHSDIKPYQCSVCSYRCRTSFNLRIHMRQHSREKPYTCEVCKRTYKSKSNLKQHMAVHRESQPYLCDMCGFTTKYYNHLKAHKKRHTGEVFRCLYTACNYSTPKKLELANHLKTHTGTRNHVCPTCGRRFLEKSHLNRHIKIHLNDKPFKCDLCDFRTARKDKLKAHKKTHENGNVKRSRSKKTKKLKKDNPEELPQTDPSSRLQQPSHAPGLHQQSHIDLSSGLQQPSHTDSSSGLQKSSRTLIYEGNSNEGELHISSRPNDDLHFSLQFGRHDDELQPEDFSRHGDELRPEDFSRHDNELRPEDFSRHDDELRPEDFSRHDRELRPEDVLNMTRGESLDFSRQEDELHISRPDELHFPQHDDELELVHRHSDLVHLSRPDDNLGQHRHLHDDELEMEHRDRHPDLLHLSRHDDELRDRHLEMPQFGRQDDSHGELEFPQDLGVHHQLAQLTRHDLKTGLHFGQIDGRGLAVYPDSNDSFHLGHRNLSLSEDSNEPQDLHLSRHEPDDLSLTAQLAQEAHAQETLQLASSGTSHSSAELHLIPSDMKLERDNHQELHLMAEDHSGKEMEAYSMARGDTSFLYDARDQPTLVAIPASSVNIAHSAELGGFVFTL